MKALMSTGLKHDGKQVNQILGKYLADPAMAPSVDIKQQDEFGFLQDVGSLLESQFGCPVMFYLEENVHEKKASNALPSRPAIVID